MKTFNEILAGMESADHLQCIELLDAHGAIAGLIENKPGSQGSLKLYHHLWQQFGDMNIDAARTGLELYAEHTADARANPGKHPNIDRLLEVVANGSVFKLHCRDKASDKA
jgi:hypothetical protein